LALQVLVSQEALQDPVGPHAVILAQSRELGQLGDPGLLQRPVSKLNTRRQIKTGLWKRDELNAL